MPGDDPPERTRLQLLRDAGVFQFKLFLDGFLDLVLAPISIVLAAIDLVTGGDRFYRLLALGRRGERWVNLFGAYDDPGLDEAVDKVQLLVREQYRKGNINDTARDAVNRLLKKLPEDPPPPG